MDDRERWRKMLLVGVSQAIDVALALEDDLADLPRWRWLKRRRMRGQARRFMDKAAEMMAEHDRRW